jgi:hypothetical protein
MIAGSTRLIYGVAQLMLLDFGVVPGIHAAGRVEPQDGAPQLGQWSLYAAVVVMAIGFYLFLSAPPGVVMILAAFRGLVPSALSFVRLSEAAISGPAGAA